MLCTLIFSCQKDTKTSNGRTSKLAFQADEALKSYQNFKSYLLSNQKTSPKINMSTSKISNKNYVSFDLINNDSYTSEIKNFYFVEFPVKYKNKNGILPDRTNNADDSERINAIVDRMLIKKNKKSGIIDYELISYIPSDNYLKKTYELKLNQYDQLLKQFSGFILHKNIGEETLYLEKVEGGEIIKKLYPKKFHPLTQ